MNIFYTGKGDKGKSIIGKRKIDKTCLEIEAVGELDELNCLIGLVKNQGLPGNFKSFLTEVQENLFIIQANVAKFIFGNKYKVPELRREKILALERLIDDFGKKVSPVCKFVIPGSTEASAWLDFLRTVARRTEREVLKFSKKHKLDPETLAYLNRLSSLFFAMARMMAFKSRTREIHPTYK